MSKTVNELAAELRKRIKMHRGAMKQLVKMVGKTQGTVHNHLTREDFSENIRMPTLLAAKKLVDRLDAELEEKKAALAS